MNSDFLSLSEIVPIPENIDSGVSTSSSLTSVEDLFRSIEGEGQEPNFSGDLELSVDNKIPATLEQTPLESPSPVPLKLSERLAFPGLFKRLLSRIGLVKKENVSNNGITDASSKVNVVTRTYQAQIDYRTTKQLEKKFKKALQEIVDSKTSLAVIPNFQMTVELKTGEVILRQTKSSRIFPQEKAMRVWQTVNQASQTDFSPKFLYVPDPNTTSFIEVGRTSAGKSICVALDPEQEFTLSTIEKNLNQDERMFHIDNRVEYAVDINKVIGVVGNVGIKVSRPAPKPVLKSVRLRELASRSPTHISIHTSKTLAEMLQGSVLVKYNSNAFEEALKTDPVIKNLIDTSQLDLKALEQARTKVDLAEQIDNYNSSILEVLSKLYNEDMFSKQDQKELQEWFSGPPSSQCTLIDEINERVNANLLQRAEGYFKDKEADGCIVHYAHSKAQAKGDRQGDHVVHAEARRVVYMLKGVSDAYISLTWVVILFDTVNGSRTAGDIMRRQSSYTDDANFFTNMITTYVRTWSHDKIRHNLAIRYPSITKCKELLQSHRDAFFYQLQDLNNRFFGQNNVPEECRDCSMVIVEACIALMRLENVAETIGTKAYDGINSNVEGMNTAINTVFEHVTWVLQYIEAFYSASSLNAIQEIFPRYLEPALDQIKSLLDYYSKGSGEHKILDDCKSQLEGMQKRFEIMEKYRKQDFTSDKIKELGELDTSAKELDLHDPNSNGKVSKLADFKSLQQASSTTSQESKQDDNAENEASSSMPITSP